MEQKDEREYLGDFEGVEWELRILRKRKIYQRIWVRGQGNLGFGCVGCGRALEGLGEQHRMKGKLIRTLEEGV